MGDITPDQCKAARAVVGWSRARLSARCGVAVSTLADFEGGKRMSYGRTLADVRRTLEDAGILFMAAEGGVGPGVRRRMP